MPVLSLFWYFNIFYIFCEKFSAAGPISNAMPRLLHSPNMMVLDCQWNMRHGLWLADVIACVIG